MGCASSTSGQKPNEKKPTALNMGLGVASGGIVMETNEMEISMGFETELVHEDLLQEESTQQHMYIELKYRRLNSAAEQLDGLGGLFARRGKILPNPEGSSADAACLQSVNMNNCVTSLPVNANECSFYIRLRLSLVTDTEFNMAASGPVERLQQLETIEKDVSNAILSAGKALEELSKEKPQMKMIENHTTGFMKTLEGVEVGLMKQINYLTQKDLLMGYHRMAHVRSRLEELEKIRTDGKPKLLQLAKSYSMPPMAKPGQLPGN
ncbi:MED11-like protein [Mya arenaria]|uniref:Mediator of RNA polymerase II transcription subunit 11 n=1 Tax=Mya arenaria TaxID=6604 RepID=A0ABY7G470_MYAAR|nr:MED11-like protein [Mya arenaria]